MFWQEELRGGLNSIKLNALKHGSPRKNEGRDQQVNVASV